MENRRKTIVYIAGPYKGKTEWDVLNNIRAAEKTALKYWRLGYTVICPHKNTALMGGSCPDKTWLDGDIEILKRCDIIVMVQGWEKSKGAITEHELAYELGIEVIYN